MFGAALSAGPISALFPVGASRQSAFLEGTAAVKRHKEGGVPGKVIFHIPARTSKYVGSPGIAVLPDGTYIAKCDLFGPLSNEYIKPVSLVFASRDRGRTWTGRAEVKGLFWASIFYHRGHLFMLGTSRCMGYTVIMKSSDGGRTWTDPADENTGLLIKDWSHTAPVPVVVHNGRVWRAMEQANGPFPWNRRFSAFMMSAPEDADLLKSSSWTFSNRIPFRRQWLAGKSPGFCDWPEMWLEGNAVITPDGDIVDMMRIDKCGNNELAAMVKISSDGARASFDMDMGLISFPGGAKKFTIRHDPVSNKYWSLVNLIPENYHGDLPPYKIRNTQALVCSQNLRNWETGKVILHHPEPKHHAFQYLDWLIEDKDIIAVSRTAYDDGHGGANDYHDANFLTFHRMEGFRGI